MKNNIFDYKVFYEDLNFDPGRGGNPATLPDFVIIDDVPYREFTSGNNQLCGENEELPHKYKLGTPLLPHAHIFLKPGEGAGTTGVEFTFYWALRTQGGVKTTGSIPLSATSAELIGNPDLFMLYDPNGFAGVDSLGAQLSVMLARTGGDAEDVIVTTYGVHYQTDTRGSRKVNDK